MMKYTNEEVSEKIKSLGIKMREIDISRNAQVQKFRKEIHYLIANSNMTYREAFSEMKKAYPNMLEFNPVMTRIRETILGRDKL